MCDTSANQTRGSTGMVGGAAIDAFTRTTHAVIISPDELGQTWAMQSIAAHPACCRYG